MGQKTHVMHGRDHRPSGADPIPGLSVDGGGGLGGSSVLFDVAQTSHGFAVGDIVRFDPGGPLSSVAFVAAATTDSGATEAATINATIPAGLATGHLLVLKIDWTNSFGAIDNAASASGFTSLSVRHSDNYGTTLLYRILNGTEPYIGAGGTVTVTLAGTDATHDKIGVIAIAYSGVNPASPFNTLLEQGSTAPSYGGYTSSYTTVAANELIIQTANPHNSPAVTVSTPAGSTVREAVVWGSGWVRGMWAESLPIPVAGSQPVSMTWTNAEANTTAFGLKPAGTGLNYVKAKADTAADAEVDGIVTAVSDANHFTLMLAGHLSGLAGLTAGNVYYLSATTAGALTGTVPATAGQVSKPLLIADTASSGFFFNWRGKIIGGAADVGSAFAAGGSTGPPGPAGPAGPQGPQGPSGTSAFMSGSGAPTAALGADGAVYLDLVSTNFWGPKTSGAWPASPLGHLVLAMMTYQVAKQVNSNYAALLTRYPTYAQLKAG